MLVCLKKSQKCDNQHLNLEWFGGVLIFLILPYLSNQSIYTSVMLVKSNMQKSEKIKKKVGWKIKLRLRM